MASIESIAGRDGASGAVRQWMVRDGGALGTVAQVNPAAGQRTTFIPDLQGSIIASLDAGSGSLVKAGYVPYGQPSVALPFGYTGLRTDAETGLTNNHARLYHPALGRFIQNDPAGYEGGRLRRSNKPSHNSKYMRRQSGSDKSMIFASQAIVSSCKNDHRICESFDRRADFI